MGARTTIARRHCGGHAVRLRRDGAISTPRGKPREAGFGRRAAVDGDGDGLSIRSRRGRAVAGRLVALAEGDQQVDRPLRRVMSQMMLSTMEPASHSTRMKPKPTMGPTRSVTAVAPLTAQPARTADQATMPHVVFRHFDIDAVSSNRELPILNDERPVSPWAARP